MLQLLKKIPFQGNAISKAEIIELVIAAEAAESHEEFFEVVKRLRGVPPGGVLIFHIARNRIAEARLEFGRESHQYKDLVATFRIIYVM
jgi:hypothetical protein